jgi:hypothetical protein
MPFSTKRRAYSDKPIDWSHSVTPLMTIWHLPLGSQFAQSVIPHEVMTHQKRVNSQRNRSSGAIGLLTLAGVSFERLLRYEEGLRRTARPAIAVGGLHQKTR